ncbi:MAG: sulfite exporter TauE/SafE family protein [Candidatus Tectomicrobia bacterium]|uniref:Probable membrane transporter protein n=1 Tax=Tectimicrobiota bacterium TaxID=2528274 RepID=A0A938B2H0_UNCTE|nr:sulfite exporter TauE/SafE family protein [Candidatus Tectomicrobia bacterium]
MDLHNALYAMLVLFVAYLVRGIAGFGSGLIAVPMLTLVAPVPLVVPLVVFLDYIGSASQGLKHREQIAWKEQLVLVPFMLVGIAGGLFILHAIPTTMLAKGLGGFVIAYAVYQLLPLPALGTSRMFAVICGCLGGMVGTLFGTGGPFYVMYLKLRDLDKTMFRATFATNFLIDGAIRLVSYAVIGLLRWQLLAYILLSLPVAGAGLYLGGRIHTSCSQQAFVRIISLLLLGSGVTLLLK